MWHACHKSIVKMTGDETKCSKICKCTHICRDTCTCQCREMHTYINICREISVHQYTEKDVLQEDTLALYLFIICQDYVLRTLIDLMKENVFTLEKQEAVDNPTQTIMNTDYAGDIMLLANISTQVKSLLHILEQAAGGIGLHGNADKMEYICFDQKGDISTLNGGSLKLVDKLIYLGSCISTENDINMQLAKIWTAIDRLSITWKSSLFHKMKAVVVSILLYGCTMWMLTKHMKKKLDGNCTRLLQVILNKYWKQHPTKQQLYSHLLSISVNKMNKTCRTLLKI